VLVVEDEFLIALEIEMILLELGHEVVGIVDTCAQAMKLAAQCSPDLATVDLRLRGGDRGEDLAKHLLEEHRLRSVFISGNLDPATRSLLEPLQPHGFINKPLSPAHLAEALARAEAAAGEAGQTPG
jgi:DNA-binding NarL/FixJ family response regulator